MSHCIQEVEYYDLINTIKPLIEEIILPSILDERAQVSFNKKNPIEETNHIIQNIEILTNIAPSILNKNIFKRNKLKNRTENSNHCDYSNDIKAKIFFSSIEEAKTAHQSLQNFIDALIERKKFAIIIKRKHSAALQKTVEGRKILGDIQEKLNKLQHQLFLFENQRLFITQDIAKYESALNKIIEKLAHHPDSKSSLENERKAHEKHEAKLRDQAIQEQREYEKLIDQEIKHIPMDPMAIKVASDQLQLTIDKLTVAQKTLNRTKFFQNKIEQWQDAKQHEIINNHNKIIIDAWVAQHFVPLIKLYDRHMRDKLKTPNDPKIVAIAMLCKAMINEPEHKASRSPKLGWAVISTHCQQP